MRQIPFQIGKNFYGDFSDVCRRCVLAALLTVKLGLTKVEMKQKPMKYSEKKKVLFLTSLKQMFKRAATDLDTQPTTTKQRLTCAP